MSGILINTGFKVGSSSPIDDRHIKETISERDDLVTNGLAYEGLKVYCKDTKLEYIYTSDGSWKETEIGTLITKVSELTNDAGYINNTVENLTNYYLKTETYTQEEINELIGNLNSLDSKICFDGNLPTTDISTSTIYLVPNDIDNPTNYEQWMYIDNTFVSIGTTSIDLTDYAKTTDIPTNVSDLTNDSGYVKNDDLAAIIEDTTISDSTTYSSNKINTEYAKIESIPMNVSALNNDVGYLTEHQDLSEYAKTTDVPTKISDLNNDSEYINNTVENLTNYYLKTETYTQEEINELVGNVNHLTTTIVDMLPTENISTTTIYLVKIENTTNYTQHMYINSVWADLGTTNIDLTDYYNKTQADSKFATQDNLNTHTSDTDIHTTAEEKTKWNEVDNKIDKTSIIDTYNVNVTNEQLFGAKTIYSELAKGFNGVLRQGCTVTDNDMNNLITPGQYETVWNTANFANLPPVKAGSSRMRVKVEQLSSNCYRQEIEFQAGAVSKGTWFRIYVDNSWSDWGKICTASVEDVAETSITCTLPEEITASSGWIQTKYVVKNGIASVHFTWYITSATKLSAWTAVATDLPIPAIEQRGFILPETDIARGNIGISISTSGVLKILVPKAITSADWWKGTFTYPVA